MTIWETVEDALSGITVPKAANVYRAASGQELPDTFLIYFLISSLPEQHGDDRETLRSWRVQVSIYSRTGLAGLPEVDGAMLSAGFSKGPERELPYNQLTGHFGLALEYVLLGSSQEDEYEDFSS